MKSLLFTNLIATCVVSGILFSSNALSNDAFTNDTSTTSSSISNESIQLETIHQFDGIPWGISLISDDEAIVTLKKGQLLRINLTSGRASLINGLPSIDNSGQGGLLDVAKSPLFNQQPWLYFTYSKPSPNGSSTTLARAKLDNTRLTQWQDLLVSNAYSSGNKHYGSRITFDLNSDNKGHVFFSIGDRGRRDNAQDLMNHAGSIIRLNLDGSVPADNPFAETNIIANEIWSYGHRNPQGIFFDKQTNQLWSNEHGPRGGDEINLIAAGANYGWPIVSYGKEYWNFASIGEGTEKEGIEKPLKVFIPSIAPSSLIRYQGDMFANWKGDFLSTALAKKHLNKVTINPDGSTSEARYLEDLNERLRSISEDSTGAIYIGTDSGKLLKMTKQ